MEQFSLKILSYHEKFVPGKPIKQLCLWHFGGLSNITNELLFDTYLCKQTTPWNAICCGILHSLLFQYIISTVHYCHMHMYTTYDNSCIA